jgi:hypothetical protein
MTDCCSKLSPNPTVRSREWAPAPLGFGQVFGGGLGLMLLVTTGVNRWSLSVAICTTIATTLSFSLYRH